MLAHRWCRLVAAALLLTALSAQRRPQLRTANVENVVGLGHPTSDCVSWNNGTDLGRDPFCAIYSDGLKCSGAWDPECT